MQIEDMQEMVRSAVALGLLPLHWRISMPIVSDLVRNAPGGSALTLQGDRVRIAGLPVIVQDFVGGSGIELISQPSAD